MRGRKICQSCKTATGPRAKRCPKCKEPFVFKHKSQRRVFGKSIDWKELTPGSIIRAIESTGPVHVNKETGEEINMGYAGEFKVDSVDKSGIIAHSHKQRSKEGGDYGRCYIYMGPEKISPTTGLLLRPHKIELLNKEQK